MITEKIHAVFEICKHPTRLNVVVADSTTIAYLLNSAYSCDNRRTR